MSVICPKCKVVSSDKDFNNGTENCSVWMDSKGTNHFECWECEHKWEEPISNNQ